MKHPALSARTAVRASTRWRNAQAARWAGCRSLDDFMQLSRDERITVIAEYEIHWRIEALQAWERQPKRKSGKP